MPKRAAQGWRGAFLRALARTGNVRAAAAAAGVDPGTAYDHRHKDSRFAGRWETARAKVRTKGPRQRASRCPPCRPGEELTERRSKRQGTQMVRTAEGRWSGKIEAAFLAELRRTGNVRAAGRAAGMSTTTLYRRRLNYPDFAAKWGGAEAQARERVPALLDAAAIASLDPDIEEGGLPPVSIDQAIAICRLKGFGRPQDQGSPGRGSALRYGPPVPSIEQVRDAVLRQVAAIRRHRKQGEGE